MSTPAEEVPQTEKSPFSAPSPPFENSSSVGSKTGRFSDALKSFSVSGLDVGATSAGSGDVGVDAGGHAGGHAGGDGAWLDDDGGFGAPKLSEFTQKNDRGQREGPAREAEEAARFGKAQEPSTTEEGSADAKSAIEFNPLNDPAWDNLAQKDKKRSEGGQRANRGERDGSSRLHERTSCRAQSSSGKGMRRSRPRSSSTNLRTPVSSRRVRQPSLVVHPIARPTRQEVPRDLSFRSGP
ncbi:hypothetical protein FIBSPDRAFT_394085 [Athelia psychrophila]|uniref:Uncharacterized protein n=1 Tax=Athelia psychrophila TaxID=1759441 RepID=A0A166NLS8_9AGAM|nr:hypothetical protein FIBSPDRAFT_394085 [Fibularhizoctonia sp. CBS 109695]